MPHQCTTCDLTFEDGSKQMLGGCPECGGNKFQFLPEGAAPSAEEAGPPADPPSPTGPDGTAGGPSEVTPAARSGTGRAGDASPADEDGVSASRDAPSASDDIIEAPTEPVDDEAGPPSNPGVEDRAQASARSAVVSENELPAAENGRPGVEATFASDAPAAPADDDDRPDIAQLREELNEQFESIKILRPGEYELNLMELYDREEYIIALEEDGRYVIDVPDTWRDED